MGLMILWVYGFDLLEVSVEDGVWMENGNIVRGDYGMHQEENPLPMSGYLGLFETCMSGYLALFKT